MPEFSRLPLFSVLRFAGADAESFLQGQLSNDIGLLKDGRTQLSAFNTPQGRVISILRLRQTPEGIFALLPTDLAPTVVQRMQRFVLRAKVQIEALTNWVAGGCFDVAECSAARAHALPSIDSAERQHMVWFSNPDGRVIVTAPAAIWQSSPLHLKSGTAGQAEQRWLAADIAAGLPQVLAATTEIYVAQMLNLDRLDAISFDKGCYTGQEIIARTQYRGRIKRRMLRYRLDGGAAPAPGTPLLSGADKVGAVLFGAPAQAGPEILAVMTLDAAREKVALEDGRAAIALPLPYAIDDGA